MVQYSMAIGDVYKLTLEGIAPGGDALGRFEGKPIFVKGGAPREIVLCRITEDRDTWAKAELLEIAEPSVTRVDCVCEFYGKCGGCNLQHIDYQAQLEAKGSILKDSFLRIGGFLAPEPEVIPSPPLEYRNRMQFHCLRQSAKGDSYGFGLKGYSTKEIIAISDCPVAVPPIRELLRAGGEGITLPPQKDRFNVFAKDNVLLNEGGQQKGRLKLLEKEINIDAGIFFQSNCFMLEKLILKLRNVAASVNHNLPMADLYCGVGTFAFYLSDLFSKTILAEENKFAVSLARENLKGMNAEFLALRDTEWLQTISRRKFSLAVIDPPRAGLAPKLTATLARDGPPLLAYVSCDPASLARDSKTLTNGGYKLKDLTLFDFYPQTAHIESLAVFEK